MSEIIGDEYEIDGGNEVIRFASEIERAASRYEPDYEAGILDAFVIRKHSMDVVGETESRFKLAVERMYTCEGVKLDAPMSEYTISTETIRHGLDITSFPSDIWERMKGEYLADENDDSGCEYSEEWLDELHDEVTEFAVGYRYQHTLRSDGTLFPESGIVLYVNETEINLPDYRLTEPWEETTEDIDEEVQPVPSEFDQLFSNEDKSFFHEVGKLMLAEFRPTKFIDDLYDWMHEIRFRSTDIRIGSMRKIISSEMPGFIKKAKQ